MFTNKTCNSTYRRKYYVNVTMGAFVIANVTTTQLGTSCPFDSPGLARDEPTPGEHPQGESTPYALRLLGEHIVFVSSCVSILGPTP